MIEDIAKASTKQAGDIVQINDNIQAVIEIAEESKLETNKSAKVASELEKSARDLNSQVSVFKI